MGTGPQGAFSLKPGQWTDDASMGMCLADSLLATYPAYDGVDLMLRFTGWWDGGYNNAFSRDTPQRSSCGLGGNISQALYRFRRHGEAQTQAGTRETSGNGSIMRLAPAPVCFHDDVDRARQISRLQSLSTHQGRESEGCCELLAKVIVTAIHSPPGSTAKEILEEATKDFVCEYAPSVTALAASTMEKEGGKDRNWQWKADDYRYSPSRARQMPGWVVSLHTSRHGNRYIGSYAMDGACMALHCVWKTTSFEEAVLTAASLCGDADSVASVAGQALLPTRRSHTDRTDTDTDTHMYDM